ncbi:MAG: hypothetical protein ABIQ73_01455 [Acidimicrobiales bacterium]
MAVRWEFEYPSLRIDGDLVVWTFKNVGDEDAPSGADLGTVTISRRAVSNSTVDTTPYTNAITLDRDVAAGTAHPMSYPLTWVSQEVGTYQVTVAPHDDVWAELVYAKTLYGVETANY